MRGACVKLRIESRSTFYLYKSRSNIAGFSFFFSQVKAVTPASIQKFTRYEKSTPSGFY